MEEQASTITADVQHTLTAVVMEEDIATCERAQASTITADVQSF